MKKLELRVIHSNVSFRDFPSDKFAFSLSYLPVAWIWVLPTPTTRLSDGYSTSSRWPKCQVLWNNTTSMEKAHNNNVLARACTNILHPALKNYYHSWLYNTWKFPILHFLSGIITSKNTRSNQGLTVNVSFVASSPRNTQNGCQSRNGNWRK